MLTYNIIFIIPSKQEPYLKKEKKLCVAHLQSLTCYETISIQFNFPVFRRRFIIAFCFPFQVRCIYECNVCIYGILYTLCVYNLQPVCRRNYIRYKQKHTLSGFPFAIYMYKGNIYFMFQLFNVPFAIYKLYRLPCLVL